MVNFHCKFLKKTACKKAWITSWSWSSTVSPTDSLCCPHLSTRSGDSVSAVLEMCWRCDLVWTRAATEHWRCTTRCWQLARGLPTTITITYRENTNTVSCCFGSSLWLMTCQYAENELKHLYKPTYIKCHCPERWIMEVSEWSNIMALWKLMGTLFSLLSLNNCSVFLQSNLLHNEGVDVCRLDLI